MAMDKFTVPNWAQGTIIFAAGFDPGSVAVRFEDDLRMVILHFKSHTEFAIDKICGKVSQM